MKKYTPIGKPVPLTARSPAAARDEAHAAHRWHVLGTAPKGSVIEGSPPADKRVAWCVRGNRRAIVLRSSHGAGARYSIQEFMVEEAT